MNLSQAAPPLKTEVVKVNPRNPEKEIISRAAEVIRNGGLVAFPTETVYGVGADALNPEAVKKIFQAKGRPSDNPIIVHIAQPEHLKGLTEDIPPLATELMNKFWPGPLTLILKKSGRVPLVVTGGQNTVAVRMPRNKVALALITSFGGPIAAPSANLSGYPSGTTAGHVFQDLRGKIDMILDAGAVEVGVESTVLDISMHPPVILRPGAVTPEQLETVIGEVTLGKRKQLLKRSPGTRYRHYSPKAEVILVKERDKCIELAEKYASRGKKVGLVIHQPDFCMDRSVALVKIKIMPHDLEGYARAMFATLRELDEQGVEHIIVEAVEEKGIGIAIMDRLRRAASSESWQETKRTKRRKAG